MARTGIRIPRPNTFLYLMSLRTGTELITFTLLLNKVSGIYGLLALLTGIRLSPSQLSMYIYSILALVLGVYLVPHIRRQSPLQCLLLAYFYLIDSIINVAYTAAFGAGYFLLLAQHDSSPDTTAANGRLPGSEMMHDAAGFTSPSFTVSSVDVVATPMAGSFLGQDAALIGHAGSGADVSGTISSALLSRGSGASLTIICLLWIARVYFIFVVMAYARGVLRQHIVARAQADYQYYAPGGADGTAENPFDKGKEDGLGWQGVLGRAMVRVGSGYWLGADEEGEWVRDLGSRFRKTAQPVMPLDTQERENRRRSGTGPPVLRLQPVELVAVKT